MFLPSANTKVYLALESTDMRKSINGLSILVIISDFDAGHLNLCFSSRLCQRQNPFRSQYKIFTILRFLLQKANKCPVKGSSSKYSLTRMDNPFMDLRMSVLSRAR